MPGAGERIMRAFESVTVDAAERDDRLADAEIWIRKVGLGWVIFFALALLAAGVAFFAMGKVVAGSTCIGIPALTAITSIVVAPFKRSSD